MKNVEYHDADHLLPSVFFLNESLVSAQTMIIIDDYTGLVREQKLSRTVYNPSKGSDMAGSPYLQDSFLTGKILMRNEEKYTGIP